MPGVAHVLFGLGQSLFLMVATGGCFTARHGFVYTFNNFFGPDIGSVSEFFLKSLWPSLGDFLIHHAHSLWGFPLLFAPFLALFHYWVLRFDLYRNASGSLRFASAGMSPLSLLQCYVLVVAGGLSHSFLEILFEDNGRTEMYQWILSTGYWERIENVLEPGTVLVVGLSLSGLLFGYVYIFSDAFRGSDDRRVRTAVLLLLTVTAVYLAFLCVKVYWIHPRGPAVGEEADLGVVVFLAIYVFAPLVLCLYSCGRLTLNSLLPLAQQVPPRSAWTGDD